MTLARIPGPIGSLFRGVQVYAFNEADHPRADDGKFGSGGGKTHTVVLPRDPRKLTTGQVTAALEQLGYKQGRRKFDLATKQAVTELTRPDGTMQWASLDEIAEILYRGAGGGDRRAKKAEPYAAILGGILGVQRYATDAQGHEHVESGPAGGQFTSKGGDKDPGEHTPGDSSGEPKAKPKADKPEAPRSHKDAYRDLIAKAKETRRAAWTEARAKAKESDTAANKAAADAWALNGDLSWESGNDAFDDYRIVDEALGDYDPDETVENRMAILKDVATAAKAALKVEADPDDDDPDRITEKDIEENRPTLQAIIAHAKAGRDHLRQYVAARREVQAIKSGKWQQYAAVLGGLGAAVYVADDLGNEHVDSGPQGGQFTSKGGGKTAAAHDGPGEPAPGKTGDGEAKVDLVSLRERAKQAFDAGDYDSVRDMLREAGHPASKDVAQYLVDGDGDKAPNPKLPDQSRPELGLEEQAAVFAYTGLSHWDDKALAAALDKCEPFPKPVEVRRGIEIEDDDLAGFVQSLKDSQESGDPVEWDNPTSAATGGVFEGNVQFTIQARRGLDADVHGRGSIGELILPPSSYRVLSVKVKGGRVEATLEQII